jgi:hypothetical protein
MARHARREGELVLEGVLAADKALLWNSIKDKPKVTCASCGESFTRYVPFFCIWAETRDASGNIWLTVQDGRFEAAPGETAPLGKGAQADVVFERRVGHLSQYVLL